jgi:hypothetical protein
MRDYGQAKWSTLLKTYDVKVFSKNGGVIFFLIGDKKYYFGIPSSQIRRKGESNWTTDVMGLLKQDFGKSIPLRTADTKATPPMKYASFGKYVGLEWETIKEIDENYIYWILQNVDNEPLKDFLEKEILNDESNLYGADLEVDC